MKRHFEKRMESFTYSMSAEGADKLATFDLVIEQGFVIDGTGQAAKKMDVGIKEGRIAALGDLSSSEAKRRLDASGLVVSPGFIDMHTHSDVVFFSDGRGESMLRQGVTTNVSGNCGSSAAPLVGPYRDQILPNVAVDMNHELEVSWNSYGEFAEALAKVPKAINIAPLIGHGTIRGAAMGFEARRPSGIELQAMRDLVRQSMEEGAFGLSSGLIFPPGMYSDTSELIEVAKVVAEFDGIYSSHIRGETNPLIQAVEEAITIGREAGVRTNISHHKAVGRDNWGKVHQSHALIAEAAQDFDLTYDMYPYTVCGGSLSQYPPPWAKDGGLTELYRRLGDPQQRARIAEGILHGGDDFPNFYRLSWEDIQIATIKTEKNAWMEGLRVSEIARRLNIEPVELVMDLMYEDQDEVQVLQHVLNDADVEFLLRQEESMIGSDGTAISPGGPTGVGKPHPRAYGAFARFLGYWVRERGVLPLEKAVHKITGKPAAKLRLQDRGLIQEGFVADITVFDPDTIRDMADFDNPHQLAVGVHWVIVNGHVTLEDGQVSSDLRGSVLRPR
jgi:N-acyl-D-amino-acid deacylase